MKPGTATNTFPHDDALIPRFCQVGDVTLDLLHRDARVDDRWLGLHPREFAVLWRLAREPGKPVTKRELLRDVWRISFEPETNSVAVHIARIRAKLQPFGLTRLLGTHSEGGYFLDVARQDEAGFLRAPARR
ncbi:MAG: winged helix-turn-helix domain-containing protein [Erythrobacter sp.]|nr:winged helix-turn-helix domain-containing protein [Erythrobacter sp.]